MIKPSPASFQWIRSLQLSSCKMFLRVNGGEGMTREERGDKDKRGLLVLDFFESHDMN